MIFFKFQEFEAPNNFDGMAIKKLPGLKCQRFEAFPPLVSAILEVVCGGRSPRLGKPEKDTENRRYQWRFREFKTSNWRTQKLKKMKGGTL